MSQTQKSMDIIRTTLVVARTLRWKITIWQNMLCITTGTTIFDFHPSSMVLGPKRTRKLAAWKIFCRFARHVSQSQIVWNNWRSWKKSRLGRSRASSSDLLFWIWSFATRVLYNCVKNVEYFGISWCLNFVSFSIIQQEVADEKCAWSLSLSILHQGIWQCLSTCLRDADRLGVVFWSMPQHHLICCVVC